MKFKKYLNEAKHLDVINRIVKKYEKNFDVSPNDVVLLKKKDNEYILYFKLNNIGKDDFLAKTENEKDAKYVQKEANKLITKAKKLKERRIKDGYKYN